jgi:hypothetical protein
VDQQVEPDITFGIISDHPAASALGCEWKPEIRIILPDTGAPGAILLLNKSTLRWTELPARLLHESIALKGCGFVSDALDNLLDLEWQLEHVPAGDRSYVRAVYALFREAAKQRRRRNTFSLARSKGWAGALLNRLIEEDDRRAADTLRTLCRSKSTYEAGKRQRNRGKSVKKASPRLPGQETYFSTLRRALDHYEILTRKLTTADSKVVQFDARRAHVF